MSSALGPACSPRLSQLHSVLGEILAKRAHVSPVAPVPLAASTRSRVVPSLNLPSFLCLDTLGSGGRPTLLGKSKVSRGGRAPDCGTIAGGGSRGSSRSARPSSASSSIITCSLTSASSTSALSTSATSSSIKLSSSFLAPAVVVVAQAESVVKMI